MSAKLTQVSDRVWYLPAHPDPGRVQPLVGIVLGDEEAILIDAGNTPSLARDLLRELRHIQAPPVTKIIYTHHHWDHVFGACTYDAQIIAHSMCRERLESEAAKPWSPDFLRSQVARDETLATMVEILQAGVQDWEAFEIDLPNVTFDHGLTLSGVGYQLELRHVGGRHADDSITVKVVGEDILFVGDCFYPPPLRLNPVDKSLDIEMLHVFLADNCQTYLHGHGEPVSRPELVDWLHQNNP